MIPTSWHDGDTVDAEHFNPPYAELENLVTDSGQSLSELNNHQASTASAIYAGAGDYYTDTGAANAYILSPTGSLQTPLAFRDGLRVRFVPANANTGASTLAISGLSAVPLKKGSVTAPIGLITGDIITNYVVEAVYCASAGCFILSPYSYSQIQPIINIVANNGINQMLVSNDPTTPNSKFWVSAGYFIDSTMSGIFHAINSIQKVLTSTWTAGTGGGALPLSLGTISPSTWYHVFAIVNAAGNVDYGVDTSLTATNLLATATGYTKYLQIGDLLTDSSSHIRPFYMYQSTAGRSVLWQSNFTDIALHPYPTTRTLCTLSTPLGIPVIAYISYGTGDNDYLNGNGFYVLNPNQADYVPTAGSGKGMFGLHGSVTYDAGVVDNVLTNNSSQVAARTQYASTQVDSKFYINTFGWTY